MMGVASRSVLLPAEARDRRRLLHPQCGLTFVEIAHRCEVHAARVLAHPDRRDRWHGVERRAASERELHVALEAAAAEAPAVADAIPRHAPFHGALERGQ